MSRALARLAGWTVGYLLVVALERLVVAVEGAETAAGVLARAADHAQTTQAEPEQAPAGAGCSCARCWGAA